MAREIRLANKTMWALEDITARCISVGKRWDKAMNVAERNVDPVMMQHLARIMYDLAFIERKAKDALNGVYDEGLEREHDPFNRT